MFSARRERVSGSYVRLSVMYDPGRRRWEAWDGAVLPPVYGLGSTPEEALCDLTAELQKLSVYAPAWILAKESKKP